MKIFFLMLIFVCSTLSGQVLTLKGNIVDFDTNEPLKNVNIQIPKLKLGTTSDSDGLFILRVNINFNDTIIFSYLGYNKKKMTASEFLNSNHIIYLKKQIIELGKTIIVEGIIADEGITPLSFSKIKRKEIEKNYTVHDIPEYLSYLPSVTFYSENGNGLGYNYLSIRGFDQRRISVSVNGIPQNDPEDHNVYWLDMPDLLESAEIIQVQRGAGAGVIGYPSIGGSINIITSPFSNEANFELSSSLGSYNTRKYSAKFSSGLINDKYSLYTKISKTLSNGYRDNSWIDFNSYHISVARYDKNITTQINFFGGPISDGLAFYGVPKEYIKDRSLRKTNFVQPREIENFSQPHYELLNEIKINENLKLNSALYLVIGEGFFDYDGSWSIYYDDYFRLIENGYNPNQFPTNALIRAQVENKQWGFIPRLSWEHDYGKLVIGLDYRNHRSTHWGSIRYAENIPAELPSNYRYYYYQGAKDIANIFLNQSIPISENINLVGEIQLAYHNYKLFNEKYLNNYISVNGLYINPRIGLNYKLSDSFSIYNSLARVTREPRLKNYYDAAESSGGSVPQFQQFDDGKYDFSNPYVKPEIMNNFELGARYHKSKNSLNLNLFYMDFSNEIVKKGQLDRFGQPITGNIDKTIHSGLELEGNYKISNFFDVIFNSSFSKNFIRRGSTFIKTKDLDGNKTTQEISLNGNKISGFPEYMFNIIFNMEFNDLFLRISGKYVGNYYSDNFDKNLINLLKQFPDFVGYKDNKFDEYFSVNLFASYTINNLLGFLDNIKLFLQVNNILDTLYASYANGVDFFPAAERNFLSGIKIGF